jgi:hypothetical protein
MAQRYHHFTGRYRGVFSKRFDQAAHAHAFSQVQWQAIEVWEVQKLSDRQAEKEKVGDFIFEEKITPKGFLRRGVDLQIEMPDGKTYSETIEQVVFRGHAGPSKNQDEAVRGWGNMRPLNQGGIVEGVVYFSIPSLEKPKPVVPPASVAVPTQESVLEGAAGPEVASNIIPNLVSGSSSPATGKGGCLQKGCMMPLGCLGKLLSGLRWLFLIGVLLGLLQVVGAWLKNNVENPLQTKKGNIKVEDRRLDPQQDTLAPQPWNYLVDHEIEWSDFLPRDFTARYTTSTHSFAESQRLHSHWVQPNVSNEMDYWHDVYDDFYSNDKVKLDSLVVFFDNQRKQQHLDVVQTAEMVTTFIQEIPYYLVHDGSCEEASSQGGFVQQYHQEGRPCLPDVVAGVQSPYEFVHNLKGDCDTRSLLGFTLLSRLGIASSVWVSNVYGHSILGVAVPVNSPHYKKVDGARHFGVELTAKGFKIGMIAPEHTDMDNWNVVMY